MYVDHIHRDMRSVGIAFVGLMIYHSPTPARRPPPLAPWYHFLNPSSDPRAGYTQSGPLFRAKTRALEKLLAKTLAPVNLVPNLIYPTGPNRLRPRDIPGFAASTEDGDAPDPDAEIDSWAWWRRDEASGAYRFLSEGMMAVAETIKAAGQDVEEGVAPIDGVIGFSQGGSMTAMVAATMEILPTTSAPRTAPAGDSDWAQALRDANRGMPLKFAVSYSGFYALPKELGWLYDPKIVTPTLHFIGSLDTVVEESRSQGLVDRCVDPAVVVHPGGHYVPIAKEWVMPLVGFIRQHAAGNGRASI
jgi:predicted esterase